MNAIRQTQQLNKRELENATPPSASWHADYRDTAWVYVGGIPLDLTEGDVVTIFSQFGNPTHLNLIRDRETGKSKGFGFIKYEDQRSCDLAVDNLTGADVLGRLLRVDHTRYKKRDDEDEDTHRIDRLESEAQADRNGKRASGTDESEGERRRRKKRRPMIQEENDLERKLAIKESGEEEDPMRDYLARDKRDGKGETRTREHDRERKHRHRHRSHRDDDTEKEHHRRRHRDVEDRGDRHSHSRHHRPEDRDAANTAVKEQRKERKRDGGLDERSPDRQRNGTDGRGRRRDHTSDDSDGGAPLRDPRRGSHGHKPSRRTYGSDGDYKRSDYARDRRRKRDDD
ncbi:RNA-binding protein Cwf29 [Knufia obscura]|uniref:RNA-binding protein Cwf29 n=1 Tax=Knufia obscura TaxID=1635080 RepID=A0ABR0RMY9_9EURO|nr:RNA-binding protein Cwf29 [Knufia obscura]